MLYIGSIHYRRKLSREEMLVLIILNINEYRVFAFRLFRNLILYLLLGDKK